MNINEFLHRIVDRLSFHTESEQVEMHAAVDEIAPAPDAPKVAEPTNPEPPATDAADAEIAGLKAQIAAKAKQDEIDALKAQLAGDASPVA